MSTSASSATASRGRTSNRSFARASRALIRFIFADVDGARCRSTACDPNFRALALVHSLLLTQGSWLGRSDLERARLVDQRRVACLFAVSVPGHAVATALGAGCRLSSSLLCLLTLSARDLRRPATTATSTTIARFFCACLPEFIAGMGIYRVYREGWLRQLDDRRPRGPRFRRSPSSHLASVHRYRHRGDCRAGRSALGLRAQPRRARARLLDAPVPMYLGRISYSLYMVQTIAAEVASVSGEHCRRRSIRRRRHRGDARCSFCRLRSPSRCRAMSNIRCATAALRGSRPASIHMLAAIYRERRAGDEAALVGDQK